MELGIDSLVAVEVRSWFLKELKLDVSVLKVIGGASLAELCDGLLQKLPKELLGGIGKGESKPASLPKEQSQPAQKKPMGSETGSIALSSAASDTDTTHSVSDTLQTPYPARASSATTNVSPARSHTPVEHGTMESKISPSTNGSLLQDGIPTSDLKKLTEAASRKITKSVPISFAQSRYWFLDHLLEDKKASNVAFYYHVQGALRVDDLERALRVVVARHESLRTCFIQDEADPAHAYQGILARPQVKLTHEKVDSVKQVTNRFGVLREHEFDLSSGELLQMVLLTLSPSSHYLLVHHHHILMDGVSVRIFLADLEKAYMGQTLGPAPRQYPDFSVAQRQDFDKGAMADELRYWKSIFPNGEDIPLLPLLPMARTSSRVFMREFNTHEFHCRLDPEIAKKVRLVAKKNRSTPFHVYLAAFQAMLCRLTESKEIVIGMADAARNSGELLSSIGFFLNLLALRFRCQLQQQFSDAITEARKTSYAALERSRLPFDVLLTELGVARSASHSPLFQAFIDYRQGSPEKQPWGDCQLEMQEWHLGKTAYDITVDVTDTPTDAVLMIRVQKGLYDMAAAEMLLETYIHLLRSYTADPSLPLGAPPLFSNKMLARAVDVGRGKIHVSSIGS